MNNHAPTAPPRPPLRNFQRRIARAIVDAVRRKDAQVITVKVARQAGKNELSSQVEALVLGTHRAAGGEIVKAAPTLLPQANISLLRIERQLQAIRIPYHRSRYTIDVGAARITFASAAPHSNTVGLTASLALELDEAQDIQPDVYERVFDPMRASTGAPVVFYGTSWAEDSLLEQQAAAAGTLAINVPWTDVAEEVPAYGRFIERRARIMGELNPIFRAHYLGIPIPGIGGLLGDVAGILGPYPEQETPDASSTYIAAVDFAGVVRSDDATNRRDKTVMAIARVTDPGTAAPNVEVVRVDQLPYSDPSALALAIAARARLWRFRLLILDATGIGAPIAALVAQTLSSQLASCTVDQFTVTGASKSQVGYHLIASVSTGRLSLPGINPGPDILTTRDQLRQLKGVYLPGGIVRWEVPPAVGHDDHAFAAALVNHVAHELKPKRIATGHQR